MPICIGFSRAVAVLGSGSTWKSTAPGRHPLTDDLIDRECVDGTRVILDIGVSDGITCLDLIGRLGPRFRAYYATDVSFRAEFIDRDGRLYFYAQDGRCALICARRLVIYAGIEGAIFPFGWIVRRGLAKAPAYDRGSVRAISLINPGLRWIMRSDPRVHSREHSVFDRWAGEQPQIIKVANVLNRAYFSDEQIRLAIRNLCDVLSDGGKLFLTDNRRIEKVSVLQKRGDRLFPCARHNGGSEITDLAIHESTRSPGSDS
jgi:hypothetical protein